TTKRAPEGAGFRTDRARRLRPDSGERDTPRPGHHRGPAVRRRYRGRVEGVEASGRHLETPPHRYTPRTPTRTHNRRLVLATPTCRRHGTPRPLRPVRPVLPVPGHEHPATHPRRGRALHHLPRTLDETTHRPESPPQMTSPSRRF